MTDALNPFWDYYVAIIAIVSILACAVLLATQNRNKLSRTEKDTTGHVWDGDLAELNNPLPRWWLWLFVITIVFGLIYLSLYPGLALYKGALGWSSSGQLGAENAKAAETYGPLYARFAAKTLPELAADPVAHAMGERIFLNTCSQCHGSDARGGKGFPNLTDDDWLHGGTPAAIETSILEGRHGQMPSMAAALGSADDVRNVANYVLSLSGSAHDEARAALGKPKFALCAVCHGPDGKGNQAIGSANLTDHIWLYGGDVDTIIETITKGREGVMPSHKALLGADRVHVVAGYVWSLSPHAVAAAEPVKMDAATANTGAAAPSEAVTPPSPAKS